MRRVGLAVVAIAVSAAPACDRVFDFNPPPADASSTCTFGPFGREEDVPPFRQNSLRELDPFELPSRLELLFVASAATDPSQILVATRPSVATDYGAPAPLVADASPAIDPAVTLDETDLFFVEDGFVHEAHFTDEGKLDTPVPLNLDVESVDGVDVSPDGLTLYLTSDGALYASHRDGPTASFHVPPDNLHALGRMSFPSVFASGDAMEVFYAVEPSLPQPTTPTEVHRMWRDSPVAPWSDEVLSDPTQDRADPMISRDGTRLTTIGDNTLYQRVRSCGP